MLIIGIDPGCSGAIVALDTDNGSFKYLLMPTIEIGKSTRVSGSEVAHFLRECISNTVHAYNNCHVFLERVGAMPGQGVTSMFTFGHAAGVVDGVCSALSLPITLVTPQAWKKHCGLIGTDKDASRSRCVQLYPDVADLHKKGKGQAISDALLIARYGSATLGR